MIDRPGIIRLIILSRLFCLPTFFFLNPNTNITGKNPGFRNYFTVRELRKKMIQFQQSIAPFLVSAGNIYLCNSSFFPVIRSFLKCKTHTKKEKKDANKKATATHKSFNRSHRDKYSYLALNTPA